MVWDRRQSSPSYNCSTPWGSRNSLRPMLISHRAKGGYVGRRIRRLTRGRYSEGLGRLSRQGVFFRRGPLSTCAYSVRGSYRHPSFSTKGLISTRIGNFVNAGTSIDFRYSTHASDNCSSHRSSRWRILWVFHRFFACPFIVLLDRCGRVDGRLRFTTCSKSYVCLI